MSQEDAEQDAIDAAFATAARVESLQTEIDRLRRELEAAAESHAAMEAMRMCLGKAQASMEIFEYETARAGNDSQLCRFAIPKAWDMYTNLQAILKAAEASRLLIEKSRGHG